MPKRLTKLIKYQNATGASKQQALEAMKKQESEQ